MQLKILSKIFVCMDDMRAKVEHLSNTKGMLQHNYVVLDHLPWYARHV